MSSTEALSRPHDHHSRRRPFSNWVKRLANLKNSNSNSNAPLSHKRVNITPSSKGKKSNAKNNPYPNSGKVETLQHRPSNGHLSFSTPLSSRYTASTASRTSLPTSHDDAQPSGTKSVAPTVSTNGETAASEAAFSKAGTSGTAAKTDGGRDSTFSSPAPSVRSLTTTLTTVHSAVTSNQNQAASTGQQSTNGAQQSSTYSHPFASSPPPTAVPSHLAPHNHPTTYHAAIANNALTDDASILTLASSTKRRRRNSLDTNASIRALAPQSVWGGSRESLPLSVLSGPEPSGSIYNAPGTLPRSAMGGLASAERASMYSSSGVVPAHASERNSYIAPKHGGGDGASVRSGRHGRNDSITNSIGPNVGRESPMAAPQPSAPISAGPGRVSRRGSGWGEVPGEESDEDYEAKSDTGIPREEKE